MSLCPDCFKGVTHEGTPKGKWEELGGVPTYVALPSGDYPKATIVLLLPDAFGPQLVNTQLLADDFARNGWKTLVPDILNGDGVPLDALDPGAPPFEWAAWLLRHSPDQTRPTLDKVLAVLKEEGVATIGATGYCFGARYVFDLAFENIIDVAAVSHPSLLKIPEDLEASCAFDVAFPHEAQGKADDILGGGKFMPGYKREYFEGCTHGFAIKGDLSNPKVKAGKEGAFASTVAWFKEKFWMPMRQ